MALLVDREALEAALAAPRPRIEAAKSRTDYMGVHARMAPVLHEFARKFADEQDRGTDHVEVMRGTACVCAGFAINLLSCVPEPLRLGAALVFLEAIGASISDGSQALASGDFGPGECVPIRYVEGGRS